ncbi:MAG: fasciclin domain-containing protein [Acidobacteriota bacterium]
MKSICSKALISTICLLLLATGAQAGHHKSSQPDIVTTAVKAGMFETLAAALTAAELVEALQAEGPFTVFAPTDEAFAKLPPGTVETLLKPENRGQLQKILTYHVVSGRVSSRQAVDLDRARTLNGQQVQIDFADGQLRIGGAGVLKTDIGASNGVIHVIDTVLLPPEVMASKELIELAIERGVPLFNAGQATACAAVYEVAATSLADGYHDEVSDSMRARLRTAIDKSRTTRDASRRAWILRYALDDVHDSLGDGMKMASAN